MNRIPPEEEEKPDAGMGARGHLTDREKQIYARIENITNEIKQAYKEKPLNEGLIKFLEKSLEKLEVEKSLEKLEVEKSLEKLEVEKSLDEKEKQLDEKEKQLDSLYNDLGKIEDDTSTKFKTLSARIASVGKSIADLKKDKANLEEKEKDYRRQLEKARDAAQELAAATQKALLEAQAQQTAKRSREGHTGGTPYQDDKKPRAKSPSQVAPPSIAPPTAWKLCTTVEKGIAAKGLRKRIYENAEDHLAFDGGIEYTKNSEENLTGDSDLQVELYFKNEEMAMRMETAIGKLAKTWGAKVLSTGVLAADHVCKVRVMGDHYEANSTPVEDIDWGDIERFGPMEEKHSEPSTIVPVEIYEKLGFTQGAAQPQSCHIIPGALVGSLPIDGDGVNRVYLDSNFHKFYDGSGPNRPPQVSFHCDTEAPLTITASFFNKTAAKHALFLRGSCTQTDSLTFKFSLGTDPPEKKLFVLLLNLRHDYNVEAQRTNKNIQTFPLEEVVCKLVKKMQGEQCDKEFMKGVLKKFGFDYQCPDCDRPFATHQALGGHRKTCNQST